MTPAEFYTAQFYSWECRGRGWFISDTPVQLEPPFIPFFRHGYPGTEEYIDDGKRHTFISKLIEILKGKDKKNVSNTQQVLDYETVEPYVYEAEITLKATQVKLPKDRRVSPDKMKALLIMLSYIPTPISFEIIATEKEIIVQFVCDENHADTLETYIKAYFPHCSCIRTDKYLDGILRPDLPTGVIDFGLEQEFVRPIQTAKNFSLDPLLSLFAIFDSLAPNEQAGIQILFQPAINSWSESILRSVTLGDGTSFFMDAPLMPQLAKEKVQSPLYGVSIRAFAQATELAHAFEILGRASDVIVNASKGPFNELALIATQWYAFETRVNDIFFRESHRLGILLNVDELLTFVHFPSEHIESRKLYASSRKTKELPGIARNKEFILGENEHTGTRAMVSVGLQDRFKHLHIIGATGTGKSTLIANLVLQDIAKGYGSILFDPHGDLIDDIIARIPKNQLDDVVLIDPSDTEYPIGLNILEAHNDIEKEVLASDLVSSFRRYATSWGDQINAVLGNAIQAMLEHPDGGTLIDLRRFLIEKDFRQSFLKRVSDPSIRYYWEKQYPILKTNSIGPILTRLDTFLRPKSIRNMVIQKRGIDFEALLNSNKTILIKLSQGLIGTENSYLLGSLILSKIHQAILSRQQESNRNPVMLYLDEFQNFITPSLKEMITGVRKYNVGLILSHQDLQQLQREDTELVHSVIGNISTRIVFRVGEPDSRKLHDSFSSFDSIDLQNLGTGEAIIRIEQPQYDCSLDTVPLTQLSDEEREENRKIASAHSRQQYATPKADVEKVLFESFNLEVVATHTQITTREPETQKVIHVQPRPVQIKVTPAKVTTDPDSGTEGRDTSTHRYLQTLVKKMAEARGYIAVLEAQLPNGSGQVDVLLTKEGKTIAVEICNTTDAEWEMHNISKCLAANYDMVVSLSGDAKQLEKIKKKCITTIPEFEENDILFFTPDALFDYLDTSSNGKMPKENVMKGYRVNVSYDAISQTEIGRKRASIAQIVMNALGRKKKD